MVGFVIEVCTNKNPPNTAVCAAAVVIIGNALSQLIVGHLPEQLGASLSGLDEPRYKRVVVFAPSDRHFARIPSNDFCGWIRDFPKKPFIGVDEVPGQVRNTHRLRRNPPIFHSCWNRTKAL
jgi:hypothetical protein